jgi:BCD family chlorophyll transporter-like MFS transporter
MGMLATGGALAAVATVLMENNLPIGLALGVFAFLLIGIGVGAAGTSLLTLLAERVDLARRAPAATIVWTMMIMGFAVTAITASPAIWPAASAATCAAPRTMSRVWATASTSS